MTRTPPPREVAEASLDELVAAAERVQISEQRKNRTLAAVLSRTQERPRVLVRLSRPAVIGGVLLLAGISAAAATLGTRWLERESPPQAAPEMLTPVSRPAPPPRPATPPPALDEAGTPAPSAARASTAPLPRRAAATASEDPAQVTAAIKALRQDHDPRRADELLRGYLRAYPRGALAEEARALLIESAVARRDPSAARLANEYLKQYPGGRFRSAAQGVADRIHP